jgi:hypothetical protein
VGGGDLRAPSSSDEGGGGGAAEGLLLRVGLWPGPDGALGDDDLADRPGDCRPSLVDDPRDKNDFM